MNQEKSGNPEDQNIHPWGSRCGSAVKWWKWENKWKWEDISWCSENWVSSEGMPPVFHSSSKTGFDMPRNCIVTCLEIGVTRLKIDMTCLKFGVACLENWIRSRKRIVSMPCCNVTMILLQRLRVFAQELFFSIRKCNWNRLLKTAMCGLTTFGTFVSNQGPMLWFFKYFWQKWEKSGDFDCNCIWAEKNYHYIFFRKTPFFRRKSAKIARNDNNSTC
jgi:hypothetical protein